MKKFYFTLVTFLFLAVGNAQIVNIPDANFKARLLSASSSNTVASTQLPDSNGYATSYSSIDTNNDGQIQVSEANEIKCLNITNGVNSILNIVGVENFTNLISLKIYDIYELTNININSLSNLNFLVCSETSISNIDISGLTNLQILDCSSNQYLTSLFVNNLINLRVLDFSGNQISSINLSNLINLTTLDCSYNQLTNLDVSGLVNLTTFNCRNNQLASLDISDLINLPEIICSYNQLTSLNVSGLTNLKAIFCSNSQLTNLDVSGLTSIEFIDVSNNQLINLNINNLDNLDYLSCEDNQLDELVLTNLPNLEYVHSQNNLLTSIDLIGLPKLYFLNCSYNQLASIDVTELPNLNTLNCQYNQLTTLFAKNGKLGNYISFNHNPNLTYICIDEENLIQVQNKVNQYGYSATCQVNSYCSFNPGGIYYTMQGNQKFDGDNNGCDANDLAYPNLKFNITNGTVSGSLISSSSGNYSIPVQAGTHTITPQLENLTYFTTSPTSATVTFPTTTSPFTQDFCIVPNGIHHDLEIAVIPIDVARPGFDANYKIRYKNKGNLNENAIINFNYNDAILDLVSLSVAPTSQTTGTLSWNVGTIAPFQSGEILVTLNVNSPMETPAVNGGDVLSYTAIANGLNTDETPDDNTFTLSQVVVNSFDPNDKTCLEGTIINPSNIGKYVHYKIRFENTGTFAAQNIVVKDMINTAKFDIASLQMTDASHSCVTRITNPNKVEFIFENINLPFDDANNDGYVVFKIKTKPTLVVGNTISNSANIYFDYNFPIVTNTATSTFSVLQNDTFEFDNYFTIYPNPVNEVLNLTTKQTTEVYSLTIYNLLGQQVQTTTNPTNTVDVSSLKTGNYIVKIVTDKGVSSSKFVKE
ncbi:MAG: leucine-rich repeat domain-containing protein [Flavobacterium sp.]|uniref:DUF7619 domain-containing protein n=1 Tax=Flavobacterium sp. TaxID=239 RepID=UPI0022C59CF9|nr:leucine-rich repeat domain-containing protein [Flavobacterium sp.]MCZ8197703.1 leucine-rich repeat domain-containing protein [Flavobacterium sp.]